MGLHKITIPLKILMTSMSKLNTFHKIAIEVSKKAGKLIYDKFYINKEYATKSSDIDLLTEVDKNVENLVFQELSDQFKDHKFVGEESISSGGQITLTTHPTWIVDPIDETMNFIHRFPYCCISLALFIDCQPVIGVIYNPILEQLFTAIKGEGSYFNGKKMQVSQKTNLRKALIMLENGSSRDPDVLKYLFKNQQNLIPRVHGIRTLGSTALNMAMVALGASDAYIQFESHIWDIAAGELLILEAGGVVIDPSGGPIDRLSRRILCANCQTLAEEVIKNIVQYYPIPRD